MMREAGPDSAVDAAARRLERAIAVLEARLDEVTDKAANFAGGLFDDDRDRLAAELDDARARERALEQAGAQASQALGRAISEIRAALGEDN